MKLMTQLIAVVIFALGSAFAQENYAQWTGSKAYALNTSASGANVAGNVTNFPVLVRLGAADSAVFLGAKTGGVDLRFAKMSGARLQHQLEAWDSAARTATVWVLLDSVKGNDSTQLIRMYWGKADAADSSKGTAVFDTANGYVAVWHMGGTGPLLDATHNGFTGYDSGSSATTAAAGIAGPARMFDGVVQRIMVAHNAKFNITQNLTVSSWINSLTWGGPGGVSTGSKYIINKGTQQNSASIWALRDNTGDALIFETSATSATVSMPVPALNQWHQVTGTYGGGFARLYFNGVQISSAAAAANLNTTSQNIGIGRRGGTANDNNHYFWGVIDEVSVSKSLRSADWVKLSFENQKAAQTLVKVANLAPSNLSYLADPANYVVNTMITPNTATVTGTVDSFTVSPALPAGLALNKTSGTISGTPTAATATTKYAVTATNANGSVVDSISITVTAGIPPAPTLAYAPTTASYTRNVAITAVTPVLGGGTVDSITVAPALPAGLSLDKNTGVISGTPTALTAAAAYVFTATNLGGSAKDTINISVLPPAPTNLVYPTQVASYLINEPAAANVPTVTGAVDSFTVAPALPAGLVFSKTTGAISGTPTTATAAANYVVTAQNLGGSAKDTVNITVLAGETFSTWAKHRDIWLNTSATNGANVAGTVTNFPVLVRFGTTDSVFAQSVGKGADLRFTKPGDVVRLKHQVEHWDSAAKTAAVWVLMDSVKGATFSTAAQLRLHVGKAGAPDLSSGSAVFDTTRGFEAVWHFSDPADSAFDATANRLNAASARSSSAYTFPEDTVGVIGRARRYGVGTATTADVGSNYIVPNSASGPLNFPEDGVYSVSAWVNVPAVGTSRAIANKGDMQYYLELRASGRQWEFSEFQAGSGYAQTLADTVKAGTPLEAATNGQWLHLVGVRNGTVSKLFLNGVMVDSTINLDANTAARNTTFNFAIGKNPASSSGTSQRYWRGKLDEVRVASVARDLTWNKLEYENQKAAQTLVSFIGPVVAIGGSAARMTGTASLAVKALSSGMAFRVQGVEVGSARLSLVDMSGRAVWNGAFAAGVNNLVWNGLDNSGHAVPAGIYMARVTVKDASGTSHVLNARVPYTY